MIETHWTKELAAAVDALAIDQGQTADVRSRAAEMKGSTLGRTLTGAQVDFVQALRSRLEVTPAASAFNAAWGQSIERQRTQNTPTPTAIMRKPNSIDDELERAIAAHVVHGVLCAGFDVDVWEGEDYALRRSTDAAAIFEALASTDSDRLELRKDGHLRGSVWLIWGNGCDLVSDHTDSAAIEAALAAAELYAEANG